MYDKNDKNELKGGWTQETLRDVLETVYRRAATDPAYRERCRKDGTTVVNEVAQTRGLRLPESTRIRFVEELTEKVFVLPPLVADANAVDGRALFAADGTPDKIGSRGQTCC